MAEPKNPKQVPPKSEPSKSIETKPIYIIVEGKSVAPEPKDTNEAPDPLAPKQGKDIQTKPLVSPYQAPLNGWPSDKLECADDLMINFSQSFQDTHQEKATFCEQSSMVRFLDAVVYCKRENK